MTRPMLDRVDDAPAPLAYTARKFAEETGIPYLAVLRLMRIGELKFVQAGRYKLIPHWAALEFLHAPD